MEPLGLSVALPLAAAAALVLLRAVLPRRVIEVASVAVAATVAVLAVAVLERAGGETLVYWFGGWEPRDGVAVGIAFVADPLGAAMACFAALLAVAALVIATRSVEIADALFHALMLVFLAGMTGFALSGDLFTLFVFFELTTVSAFVLAAHNVEQRTPLEGSLNFAITNTIGSFLLLLGIGLVYGRTGALNLAQIGEALAGREPDGLVVAAFTLIAAGFLVKAAVVPFHFWLADAYAVARTPVCIMLAAAMSELGVYGLARTYWTAFSGTLEPASIQPVLIALGVATALLGAAMALVQTHLKRLLAFSTIASIGLLLTAAGLLEGAALAGAALFVLGDGLVKAALFACVGIVQHRRGHIEERALHGGARELRYTGALFALAALALASLPPFGSFLGKAEIEHGAESAGHAWLVPLFVAVPALTGAAVLRVAGGIFLGLGRPARAGRRTDEPEETEREREPDRTPATMFVPAAALLAAALAAGLWPGLADAAHEGAERFMDRAGYASAVLDGRTAASRQSGAEPLPWHAYPLALLTAAGAVFVAWASLERRRLPAARRVLEPARRPLRALRELHSGHPGDYVAWMCAGTTAVGGGLALLVLA
jgi:multicomponent Na+:H+ antiporter subunit D